MKNMAKNAKRFLSLALALSIVVMSLAGAIVVSAETTNELLPLGTFESYDVGTPEPLGLWGWGSTNQTIAVTDEAAHNGTKSLKITKTNATGSDAFDFPIALSADKSYMFSAYIKVVGATEPTENTHMGNVWAQVKKSRFDSDLKVNGNANIQNKLWMGSGDTEGWQKIYLLITGLEADAGCIMLYSRNVEAIYYDDISVTEVEIPDTGLIAGGNMEGYTVGDTGKYGYGYSGNRTVVDTDAHSFNKSIHIGDNGGQSWMYVPFSENADPEKTYMFTAYVKVNSVNTHGNVSDIFVQFEKASGGNISGDWYAQFRLLNGTTNGEWVRVATTFTGGDAKAALIGIHSSDAYIDDISVQEITLTNTGLINNGNFEKVPNNNPESFAWFPQTGSCNYTEITNADAHNGAKALKLTKPGDWTNKISNFYVKDNLTLSAGKTYLLTAYVKMIGTTELTSDYHFWVQAQKVNHFGESMKLDWSPTIQNKITNGEKADWTKVQIVISGHTEDIKSLQFNVRNMEEFWIDDLSVVEIEPVVTEGIKLNGDFESLNTDMLDANIGWFNWENNYTREVTNEDSYTGAKSLKISKTAEQISKDGVFHMDRGYTSTLAVGKVYELTAYIKVVGAVEPATNSHLGNVFVEMMTNRFGSMVNINGNTQTQNVLVTGNTDGWQKVTLRIEGHNQDFGDIRFIVRYASEVWFDDISIVEVETVEPEDPVVKPDAPESTGLVNYGTFENVPDDNQEFFAYFNGNQNQEPSITTEDSYSGAKSLKISKPGDLTATESVFYMNTGATLEVGKAYELSAYIKVVGAMAEMENAWMGNLQVEMQPSRFGDHMIKVNGSSVQQNMLWSGNTDGWQKITFKFAGHNEAITSMRFMARYAEEVWIDDLTIVEVEYVAAPTDTGLIPNGTMEALNIGAAYGQTWAGAQAVTSAEAYTGFKSLQLNGNGAKSVVHENLTATTDASKAYLFSAWIKTDSLNDKGGDKYPVWAQFTAADGTSVPGDFYGQHKLLTESTNGEWVKLTKVFTGVEITGFDIWAYSDEAYVDDVSLVETTLADTGLMTNGSFETSSVGTVEPNGGWGWSSGDTTYVTNEDAYSGAHSFKIVKADLTTNRAYDFPIALSASKSYQLTARIKVKGATVPENAAFGNVWLQVKNGRFGSDLTVNGSSITQNKLWAGTGDTDGWVEVSMALSGMSADITHLVFYYTCLEELWFDDITVTELDWKNTGIISGGHMEGLNVGASFGSTLYSGTRVVTDEDAYTGDKSLYLSAADSNGNNVIHQDFNATTDVATTYQFSAWVKFNNVGNKGGDIANMFIQFYNADNANIPGKFYAQVPLYVGETTGEWIFVSYTFTGIAAKGMDLYIKSADAYVDDICVVALEDTAIVPDGSFENDSSYRENKDVYSIDTTVAHTGTRSLKVTTSADEWRENDNLKYITVDPTKTYSLKVWAKADVATENNTMYLKYTDANGANKYKYYTLTTDWAEYDMVISQLDASNATARIAISLGVTSDAGGDITVWFDDLSVVEIPDLYTNVIPAISTGKLGETFFVDDAAAQTYKFDLKVVNSESYDLTNGTAVIDIYNYATDKYVSTQTIGLGTVAAGETFTKNIKVYGATEFGTYRVAITLKNEDFTEVYDRYFTVAKKSYNNSNYLAINEHGMDHGGGDIHGLVQPAGFGWVCTDIRWSSNIDENGNISFLSAADEFIAKCEADGLKIRANVSLGEFVADTNGNGYVDTEEEAAAFGVFCREMAKKYKGKVAAYEIMSEYPYQMQVQNTINEGGEWFAWIMREAYTNIKAEDPDAIVVLGAMNSSYWYNEIILEDMLDTLYDDTNEKWYCFDAFGIHPYTNPSNPIDGDELRLGVEDTVAMFQNILENWEIDEPIWLSEVGFSTATESDKPNTVEEQAAYLMQLYLASRACDKVEFLSFYNLQSGAVYVNNDAEAQYGITFNGPDGVLYTKPSYAVMNTMSNLLEGITFVSKTSQNGAHAYTFRNVDGQYITAVWTADGTDALATVAAAGNTSAVVVDSWGNEKEIGGTNFVFDIGVAPVFLVTDSGVGAVNVSEAIERITPVFAGNFNNYIEVVAVEGYEYSIDGINYSAEARFEGLNPNTVYTVFCRDTATGKAGTAKFRTSAHGDLDNNGLIQGADLTLMRKLLFTEKDPEGINVDAKDVNDNGEVDILDLVNLKKLCLEAE